MRHNSFKTFIFLSLGTLILLGVGSLYLFSCKKDVPPAEPPVGQNLPPTTSVYTYEIVATYPHDANAFTQGLQYADGILYEGTGREGMSNVRHVDLKTGKVLKEAKNDPMYFGEGIVILGDKLYQLTYTSEKGFIYDKNTLAKLDSFKYRGEGWGLTTDGTSLIMSNGSAQIDFLDPATKTITRSIQVTDGGNQVMMLNELEYVKGEIWANIWMYDMIARIDPATGKVLGWIDLSGILPEAEQHPDGIDVLNGIAYDAATDRIFVTGKLWPKLFEIRIKPRSA